MLLGVSINDGSTDSNPPTPSYFQFQYIAIDSAGSPLLHTLSVTAGKFSIILRPLLRWDCMFIELIYLTVYGGNRVINEQWTRWRKAAVRMKVKSKNNVEMKESCREELRKFNSFPWIDLVDGLRILTMGSKLTRASSIIESGKDT